MARILAVMPGSSARGVALAVVLSATVAGCSSSDGEKPRALPTIPTATPSSTSPTPLASATADTSAASVVAFIKSYYAEINRAVATGNVEALRALSVPGCGCRQLVEFIADGNGGPNVTGGRFTIRNIATHDVTPTLAGAKVTYDVAAAEKRDSSGKLVKRLPAFTAAQDDLSIVRHGDSWLVAEVVELTQ